MILRLARWFEVQGWREPVSAKAALLLAPIREVAPEVRITLKKLRYTIEFLKGLFDEREVKALEKRLKPLQDDLGYMNDLRTAHDLVAEVGRHAREHSNAINRAGGMVLGWHNRILTEHESRLR